MRVLVTANVTDAVLQEMRKNAEVVDKSYLKTGHVHSDAELAKEVAREKCDALIVEHDEVGPDTLAQGVKMICCCRNELKNIDFTVAAKRGVTIISTPGRNTNSVAEMTVCVTLMLLRNVAKAMGDVNRGLASNNMKEFVLSEYERYRGREINGKTVGIIGLGRIGSRLATLFTAFGARVVSFSPNAPDSRFERTHATRVSLDYLLRNSDIVIAACSYNRTSDKLIGEAEISRMKRSAYLINLADPRIINEDALYDFLKSGRIAGAAMDIVNDEPLGKDNRFLKLDNAILTPHIGGCTKEAVEFHSSEALKALRECVPGKEPNADGNGMTGRNPPKDVVIGILMKGRIFLVEKRREDAKIDPGIVSLPGGHVEIGESLVAALKREMNEELCIEIRNPELVFNEQYTASNGERQSLFYFLVKDWQGNIASREAKSVFWTNDIETLSTEVDRKVMCNLLRMVG